MKAKGKELVFISRIAFDGKGISLVDEVKHLREEVFDLRQLSISNKTYIASAFNTYTVKLKRGFLREDRKNG